MKPSGYWNIKENCLNEARKYSRRVDLKRGNNTAYKAMSVNGWLQEACQFMEKTSKKFEEWTIEECLEKALLFDSRKIFSRKQSNIYNIIKRNKWDDIAFSHMKRQTNYMQRCIYVYEFVETSCAYIGLTYNIEKRQKSRDSSEKDQVTKYIKKTGLIPIRKILTPFVEIEEAIKLEGFYVDEYKNNGWTILNVAKTGGIGGGSGRWPYEKCKNLIKKFKTLSNFKRKYFNAYCIIMKNSWNELIEPLIQFEKEREGKEIITSEMCEKIALEYDDRKLFKENEPEIYESAKSKKILKSITSHMKQISKKIYNWDDIEECKKCIIKYSTMSELHDKNHTLYKHVIENNLADLLCSHMDVKDWNERGYWTKERCIEKGRECKNRQDFCIKYPGGYWKANKNNWLNEVFINNPSKYKPKDFWNRDMCYSESLKYSSRKKFYEGNRSAYEYCRTHKLLDEFYPIINPIIPIEFYNNKNNAKIEASKYNTRTELSKESQRFYKLCCKNGWIDEFYPKKKNNHN